MEIAPGIRRLGPGLANAYLVDDGGAVTIVDAGAPGYWSVLPGELAAMGRTLDDVRAVVLTHAHIDHIGFAERIRRERGVPVSVHELDLPLTRKPAYPKWNGSLSAIAALRFFVFALGNGMARVPPILEVSTFVDGTTLDVPGSPHVIHVPGHSEGMAALHFASRDAIFVGDAFVTLDVLGGGTGPRITPSTPMSIARTSRLSAWTALTYGSYYLGMGNRGRAACRKRYVACARSACRADGSGGRR